MAQYVVAELTLRLFFLAILPTGKGKFL